MNLLKNVVKHFVILAMLVIAFWIPSMFLTYHNQETHSDTRAIWQAPMAVYEQPQGLVETSDRIDLKNFITVFDSEQPVYIWVENNDTTGTDDTMDVTMVYAQHVAKTNTWVVSQDVETWSTQEVAFASPRIMKATVADATLEVQISQTTVLDLDSKASAMFFLAAALLAIAYGVYLFSKND